MDHLEIHESLKQEEKQGIIQPTWLWILPIFLLLFRGGTNKLDIKSIEASSLEKKAKLLERIKGYMNSEEQIIIHRAEMLLHIMLKVKGLLELPELLSAETRSHTLSFNDRKRHMLMDISEFVDEDKREVIHKAIDLHLKASTMENKIQEIKSLNSTQLSIDTIEKYIDIFDPLLEGDLKNKTKELRILAGILKLMKSLDKKEKLDEMDIIEIIKPFMNSEQGEQLGKMIQIFKAVSSIGEANRENPSPTEDNLNNFPSQTPTNPNPNPL